MQGKKFELKTVNFRYSMLIARSITPSSTDWIVEIKANMQTEYLDSIYFSLMSTSSVALKTKESIVFIEKIFMQKE